MFAIILFQKIMHVVTLWLNIRNNTVFTCLVFVPPFSSQSFRFLERHVSIPTRRLEAPEPSQNQTHWTHQPVSAPCAALARPLSLAAPGRRLRAPHHTNHSAPPSLSTCMHIKVFHLALFGVSLRCLTLAEKKQPHTDVLVRRLMETWRVLIWIWGLIESASSMKYEEVLTCSRLFKNLQDKNGKHPQQNAVSVRRCVFRLCFVF